LSFGSFLNKIRELANVSHFRVENRPILGAVSHFWLSPHVDQQARAVSHFGAKNRSILGAVSHFDQQARAVSHFEISRRVPFPTLGPKTGQFWVPFPTLRSAGPVNGPFMTARKAVSHFGLKNRSFLGGDCFL
jgi:hypothetical protein